MRVREVSGYHAYLAAMGKRDKFLLHRRINWGNVFGWAVLLLSGAGWGLLIALATRGSR